MATKFLDLGAWYLATFWASYLLNQKQSKNGLKPETVYTGLQQALI